jgi:RHS repeat-associated protein
LHARDYETADGDFVIGRSYRSIPVGRSTSFQTAPVGLASGWNFDFMYELQLAYFSGSPSSPNAKLALVAPDGTAYDFVMQSGGAFVADTSTGAYYAPTNLKIEYLGTLPSDLSTLQSASTQWRVTDGDDTVWTFQTFSRPTQSSRYAVGRPTTRVERNGYRWDLAYRTDNSLQRITDSFGRQATFNWSLFYVSSLPNPPSSALPYPEAVSSISLPDGTSLRYTYDPPPSATPPSRSKIDRLIKVERLDSASIALDSTTYAYGDSRFPHHVTGITDFSGHQVASYAYDARGRGISTAHTGGADSYTVADTETASEFVRTVTNPLGKVEDYHFQKFGTGYPDVRLTSISGQTSANTPASTSSITYGSDNFIGSETDAEGHTTSYTRDSRGRPTTIVEAVGTPQQRTTTITWDATYNLPTSTIRPGLTETRTYNGSGQLATVTLTDTTSQSVPDSTNGRTRTWTYSWSSAGRLLSINGPLAADGQGHDDVTTFTYDAQGNNLLTMADPAGHVTSYGNYDANGRPGTLTDPNGVVTAFTYDAMGRVRTVTAKHPTSASLDAVTTLDYDSLGRVSAITLPSTETLYQDYDTNGRLVAMRAANGERRDYAYDADGDLTSETVKRSDATVSQQITRAFDELGRTIAETVSAPNTNRWSYDKVGNVTQIKEPNGKATTQAFDALNRLVTTVAPDSGTTARDYDVGDNLVSHTDPISVTTQYVRDGFGDIIQESSPDRGTSTYWYDSAGRIIQSQDGRGQVVSFTRDYLGRVTQKVPTGRSADAVSYVWDTPGLSGSYGAGRLSSVSDSTGTTSFAYDHRGNLVDKRQVIGSGTADLAYVYDLADRVTQITYPSGRLVQYTYDTKGRVSQVQTKATGTDPNWTVLASGFGYEPFASVKTIALGNGLSVTNDWGNDGRLASRRLYRTSNGTNLSWLTYNYDANDNIGAIRDKLNDANSSFFAYDANDRLTLTSLSLDPSANLAETYSYTAGTNRLASLVNASGTRSISYDGRGNTIGETRPGGGSVTATYDGYGRLLTYNRTGDPSQTNAYNGLDDRVSATSGSVTHSFLYDSDGRLLGEYGASASDVIAETIWLSPRASANDNQPFRGEDGVAGYAPLAVATGSGSSAALFWLHGNHLGVPILTTDTSGAAATPPAHTMAGFPGQTKTLSDIYYNRYRDYDSGLGRYIQADPMGLEGGDNSYVYADDNPLRFTDPMGLSSLVLPIPKLSIPSCPWCGTAGAALALAPYEYKGGEAIGGFMVDVFNAVRHPDAVRERKEYKRRYAEQMPPGLDECEKLAWLLAREKALLAARLAWDAKWGQDHAPANEQSRNAIKNLEEEMKRRRCPCPSN